MTIEYWIEGDDCGWYTVWSMNGDDDGTYEPHCTRDEAIKHARREAKALSKEYGGCLVKVYISGTRSDKGHRPQLLQAYGGDQVSVNI